MRELKQLQELTKKIQSLYTAYEDIQLLIEMCYEENDVSVKQIKQWVREERLSFTEESQITLECENCGAKILTGRFCEKCKTVLHNDLSGAIRKPSGTLTAKPKDNHGKDRMRYLDN